MTHCYCDSIRYEVRRDDGWLYCGGCGGRIGDGPRPSTPTSEGGAMLRNEAQRAISTIRNTARDFKARGAEREAGVLLRQSDVLADIIRKLSNNLPAGQLER